MKAYILVDYARRQETFTVVFSDSDALAKSYFLRKMESRYGRPPKSYGILRYPKLDVYYSGKMELDTSTIALRSKLSSIRSRICQEQPISKHAHEEPDL